MIDQVDNKIVVVIPNWNGQNEIRQCVDSVLAQTEACHIIVIDNGSTDNSVSILETSYPQIELIKHSINKGYAGGVNPGFRRSIELSAKYVAPFNNDAIADKNWLKHMVEYADLHEEVGIVTCKVASSNGKLLDSTGDFYTSWGLAYPRGRDEADTHQYDDQIVVFGASGAASLYRVSMLEKVGNLDEDFFAYYEDVDLSFRAQLAGWKVAYIPKAVVYHAQGTTSRKFYGFSTYHTMKNYPWLFVKNVPTKLLLHIGPRFAIAYTYFIINASLEGRGWFVIRGVLKSLLLLPKKLIQRYHIQSQRTVTSDYIWNLITHDLPPKADKLRSMRTIWFRMIGKS